MSANPECVFCLKPIESFYISHESMYTVSGSGFRHNSTYAHKACYEGRDYNSPKQEPAQEAQAVMELA